MAALLYSNYCAQQLNRLEAGEELEYEVSYSFIKLGVIKIKITEEKGSGDNRVIRTTADIYSYPAIPFVNLNEKMESIYNLKGYSEYFRALHLGYEPQRYSEYIVNKKNNSLRVKKGIISPYKIKVDSIANINSHIQDGLSLLYHARRKVGLEIIDTIKCFIVENLSTAVINFNTGKHPVTIDNCDYKIDCIRLSGNANFVGLYGLTGEFEGWFTNDGFAVPVTAKLKVLIGSISVELKKWRKKNWQPPRFTEK